MPARSTRWPTLTQWILISMVVGTTIGWVFPATAVTLEPLSTIFLRLIKSLVVPLVFSTLVVGVAGHGGDLKAVGRLAVRAIVYFEVVTTLALVVGLLAGNLAHPGTGVSLTEAPAATGAELAAHHVSLGAVLVHMVPQSIVKSSSSRSCSRSR
jgi:proton glutamate symport protein